MHKYVDAIAEKVRLVGAPQWCLLGMTVLLTASTGALADTTTLLCHVRQDGFYSDDEPTIVELNQAQGTVVVHFSAEHNVAPGVTGGEDGQGGFLAYSMGPMPAVFGANAITFSTGSTINRLTGDFVANNGQKFTCKPGKPQF
jgi:hypothetical protein